MMHVSKAEPIASIHHFNELNHYFTSGRCVSENHMGFFELAGKNYLVIMAPFMPSRNVRCSFGVSEVDQGEVHLPVFDCNGDLLITLIMRDKGKMAKCFSDSVNQIEGVIWLEKPSNINLIDLIVECDLLGIKHECSTRGEYCYHVIQLLAQKDISSLMLFMQDATLSDKLSQVVKTNSWIKSDALTAGRYLSLC